MWNIIYLITGAMFVGLLAATFFTKGMINTKENKLFKLIIISNIAGYLIEIPLQLIVRTVGINNIFIDVLCRLYMVSITANYTIFTTYVFVICLNKNKEQYDKKIDKISTILKAIEFLVVMLLSILPFEKYYDTSKMYIYGQALDFLKLFITCHIGIYFVLLIRNYKELKNKKYLPIYFIIILIVFMTLLNSADPSILITNMIVTFICYTMSFTIENPDLRLLEEVHKSKQISDTANEEKTMFLYNMTQEIRNTTDEINDSANEILDSSSLEENKDSARNIIATTSKFTSMTNEILDVSQVDSENIKTYNSKYDIKNTLKQIVNIYNEECKKKMLEFRTNIDHDIPESLYGDSISLKEALNKILKNSLNNTTTGYIEFNVNTIIKNDVCRLIITIEDSSNGIQSEELNTIKKDNKLLSEANSLIGVMNGAMMVSSDFGLGTKVKVILDQKIVDTDNKEVTKYVNTLDNVNVLACDTESGLKVISKLLDDSKIKLDKVDNGKELLESIKENKYDLVLMDESTSTNNRVLVSKIKAIRNFNSEIILLTRDNSYEYNDEYKNLGFDDYILKPLKKDILLEKINKYKDN